MTWEIEESRSEEVANAVLHGVGAASSIAGLAVLVHLAAREGDAWRMVATSVYGTSLVLLYLASTLYHAFPWPGPKRVFEILDHAAIYVLIAGTYTPFAIVTLRGPWGWSILGVVWGLAVAGVVVQVVFPGRLRGLMTGVYVAMGWLVIVAFKPLFASLSPTGLAWLAAGGVAYTAGVWFYARKRFRFSHAVWHVFVLAGSAFHFIAILRHVVPIGA